MTIDIFSFIVGMIAWEMIRSYISNNIKNRKDKKKSDAKPNNEKEKVEITKETKEYES